MFESLLSETERGTLGAESPEFKSHLHCAPLVSAWASHFNFLNFEFLAFEIGMTIWTLHGCWRLKEGDKCDADAHSRGPASGGDHTAEYR